MARRFVAAIALVLLGAVPAVAGEPTDRLRTFFEQANRALVAPEPEGGLEERVTAVRALVSEVFDFEGAAALALGRHWAPLSPPARAEFVRLYADLIERAYLAWVGGKARVSARGVTSRWVDESVASDVAMVTSALLTRTGDEFPIEYLMIRRADRSWVVRDVVVDGLSLAANYHVQFGRVIQTESFDELLVRLREKAGPVARTQATAAAARAIRAMAPAPSASAPPPAARVAVEEPIPVAAPVVTARPLAVAELRQSAPVVADVTPSVVVAAPAPPPVPAAPARTVAEAAPPPAARRVTVRPEPSARPVAAVARTTPPRREFWVQVGAFRTADAATRLVQRLRRHAVTIALNGNRVEPLARVFVGPFAERAAAVAAVRELQARGIAAFIADTLR